MRALRRWAVGLPCVIVLGGCGSAGHSGGATTLAATPAVTTAASATSTALATTTVSDTSLTIRRTAATIAPSHHADPASATRPLAGDKVGVDPGHNGRNGDDLAYIDHLIWNGREWEPCNTTGTETDSGYTEARFNWNVARHLTADLQAEGATVVLTRHDNDGVGPCVNQRAAIMNRAHVRVAIAIHADGGPPDGRGFTILEPVPDGINDRSIAASHRFARILRARFLAMTGMPESTYDGVDGLKLRDDLAGENLTREPYALIETGNMRNATDAALLTNPRWQQRAARAICAAITAFLDPGA